ncbi:peptidase inhibitor family I36 protein [Amycolatopsis sp. WQ 127309]|uniref:peptidase inhibitor family I36 protein n=1 Tax=Amycolatopsis sp. WQ 127309 TaxID=2932773 RepID=UPI001FF267BF|nr:peptidase inhibitor family I36 protein [Amycolatopsis sp. WQ 127309]UOZ10732.1 peptidase inhibitor family I36 protein [Amycolatopsis sp. WQ 127309]
MQHRISRLVLLTVAAAVPLVTAAAPAEAATGYARCPSGYFCVFADANGGGTIAYFHHGSPDLRQQGIDNTVSSVWDRSAGTFALCDRYGYAGNLVDVFSGAKSNLDAGENNRASSVAPNAHGCN